MRAGKLDRSITIQGYTYVVDEYGNPIYDWAPMATVRAEIIEAGSEEFIRSFGVLDQAVRVFRIRFLDGVTNGHRVLFEGVQHDIKSITEIQRRKGLEIRAVARAVSKAGAAVANADESPEETAT